MEEKKEEKKYNGWLISNNIFERGMAVYLHFLIGFSIVFIIVCLTLYLGSLLGFDIGY